MIIMTEKKVKVKVSCPMLVIFVSMIPPLTKLVMIVVVVVVAAMMMMMNVITMIMKVI